MRQCNSRDADVGIRRVIGFDSLERCLKFCPHRLHDIVWLYEEVHNVLYVDVPLLSKRFLQP